MPDPILIIGRTSFFANQFAAACADLDIRHISHTELERPGLFDRIGTVVNFAFNPRLYRETYAPALDLDRRIAEQIADRPVRYILLSSRTVYGSAAKWQASEAAATEGDGTYGTNRVAVEQSVSGLLPPERLVILRISNTIAYELQPGRRVTFMSRLLGTLRDHGEIRYDMSPDTQRDFITDTYLCRVLRYMAVNDVSGVFNVGCGFPVRTGDLADWIIEGFGRGRLVVMSQDVRDEFYLETKRLGRLTGLTISPEELHDRCLEIGRRLGTG